LPKHELFEIHHSTISTHHAKEGYDYPTIRLPHTFSTLAGLSTSIYQTVHDGALAFLVVGLLLTKVKKAQENQKTSPLAPNPRRYTSITILFDRELQDIYRVIAYIRRRLF